jgi:antitoxin component HigA of HigAB toxin-antitoxin module
VAFEFWWASDAEVLSRVSEILARKRKLTLKMMRALHAKYHIPLELLIQDYPLAN